jgi:hypothetical protein
MQVILISIILLNFFIGTVFAQVNQNCTSIGNSPSLSVANRPCCQGLSINNAGRCDTIPVVDTALSLCNNDSQCSGGSACLPQTTSVMFSGHGPTSTPEDYPRREEFETQLNGITSPKDNGASCAHSKECKSYNCVGNPGQCNEKKICRFSAEGEFAGANVNCGPDLVKAANGICQKSADSQNGLYAGLLENPGISSNNECKMTIDQDTILKSKIAMRSIRAMEWLFSTINVMGEDECLGIFPLLREEIGKTIYSGRKNILKNYSTVMSQIEVDFQTVLTAGDSYKKSISNNSQAASQDVNVMYDGVNVSQKELGSRLSSGYDAMLLTYRKNLLHKSYEMAMIDLLNRVSPKLSALSTAMGSWSNDAEAWSLGQTVYNNRDCEGSRYEVKEWWDWDSFHYHALKDRYAFHYYVTGSHANNSSIIERENVKNVLALIGGFQNPEDAVTKFKSPYYVLMDPPMFGGLTHGSFGQLRNSSDGTGILGWGGFRDHRKRGDLDGNDSKSLKAMHDKLKLTVKDFYKSLKEDPQQKKFIFEPELVDNAARDCFDSGRTENCSEFDAFLDEVVDESFAHFLSYSMRKAGAYTPYQGLTIFYNDRYKDYFNDATSLRRKLLAKLEVDIQNLSVYYSTIIAERDKQNACIEKISNGIIDSGILAGGGGGIQEGNYNNGGASSLNPGAGSQAIKSQKLTELTRNNYTFNLQSSSLSKISDSAKFDGSIGTSSNSEGASVSSGLGATLAVRMKSMKDKNTKAALAGVKVDSKIKAANDIMNSMGSKYAKSSEGTSTSNTGASSANGGKAFSFGDGTGASTSGENTNDIGKGSVGASQNTQNGNGQYGIGSSTQSTSSSDEEVADDGTGMNDDEKEKLLTTVENNKDKFRPNEEDGIFKVVSKAYVRNLDRILIRKKKIEPELSNLK